MPLKPATVVQRLLGRPVRANLIREVRNLLADEGIAGLTDERIAALEERYRLSLTRVPVAQRTELYETVLRAELAGAVGDGDRNARLDRLRHALALGDVDIRMVRENALGDLLTREARRAMADGTLDSDERAALAEIERELEIPVEVATRIYRRAATERLNSFIERAVADQRLSPEEEAELERLRSALGFAAPLNHRTQMALERCRLFWQIENGDAPQLDVDIRLHRGERCLFRAPARWYELRRVTKRVNYGGPTLRIKIVKGVYWRAGSLGVQRVTEDEHRLIDEGTFYLTERRVIFRGRAANKVIRHSRILDFEVFTNGVRIEKDAGRSPFLEMSADTEVLAMLFGRVLRDAV